MLSHRIFLLVAIAAYANFHHVIVQSLSQPVIRVCQNKNCLKRNGCLLQTVSNLVPSANVEASGCLSLCTEGPNVEVENKTMASMLNGVYDAPTAAIKLEEVLGAPIPKLLTAASKLMEQVPNVANKNVKGRSADEFDAFGLYKAVQKYFSRLLLVTLVSGSEEGMRYLNSVISKLEQSEFSKSPAMAQALALRAKLYLSPFGERIKAIQDAERAIKLKHIATAGTLSTAYRVWADAEENPQRIIAVLQQWHLDQPSFRRKLQTEIQSLVQSMEG
eukprot:scaffold23891_cov132-Cylindrotheca_fusiformis.AAC.2